MRLSQATLKGRLYRQRVLRQGVLRQGVLVGSCLAGAVALAAAAGMAGRAMTPQQADAFDRKLDAVIERGELAPSGHRTEFAGDELNAYLQLRLTSQFPTGVADPSVTLVGQGRLSGRAIVDLDGIRQKSSGGWFDPAAYLSGKLPVTATGTLQTSGGSGRFVLERADVSGVPIPKTLLQEVVTFYTRTAVTPNGVNLDQPFDLPLQIQRIDVNPGRAVVVQ